MLGSPNYVRFVYDGDGSDTDPAGPPGSDAIEKIFTDYFDEPRPGQRADGVRRAVRLRPVHRGRHPRRWPVQRRRGHQDAEQAAIYGGTAGAPYDACYHQACDTINNLSTKALSEMGDAAAHAVWTLAKSKSGIQVDGSRVAKKAAKKVALTQKGHTEAR